MRNVANDVVCACEYELVSSCVADEIEFSRNQRHTCTNSTTHELNRTHFIANTYTCEMSLHEISSRKLDCTNVCVCDEVRVVEFVCG